MRKIAITLVFLLLVTIACPATAIGDDQAHGMKTNRQYGRFYQHEDEHGRMIREYRSDKKGQSREYTYAVLTELGMEETFIAKLSDESVDMYANAESITSITTYICTDATGESQIVSEEVAVEEAASTWMYDPPLMDNLDGEYTYVYPTYTGLLSNTYIKITFVVTYKGDAVYHFSVDAEWLTTPDSDERYYEAIGVSATHITIQNDTRTGWYSYLETHPLMQEDNEDRYEHYTHTLLGDNNYDGQEDHIKNYVDGNWNGSGAIFSFPEDSFEWWSLSEDHIKQYSEFKAHYEFEGIIAQPEQTTNFAAVASYDHCTIQLTVTPTLEISETFGGALAFNLEEGHNIYVVELDSAITYEP